VPDAVVTLVVTGGPEGRKAERSAQVVVRDGRVAEVTPGDAPEGEADLVITQPWDDVHAAIDGSVPLDEAFMRGTSKVVGSTGLLMDLLAVVRSDEWREACGTVVAQPAR
jgi:hypothetical protein